MDRADYEWHYYIGGNCALKRRKYGGAIANIVHIEQGVYEASFFRDGDVYKTWSLGIYQDSNEAQKALEKALQPLWEKA